MIAQDKALLLETEHTALAAEITDEVKAQLPQEKANAAQQMAQTAKDVREGHAPTSGDGRGQAMASIPPIVYMRWQLEYPGCWQDKGFLEEFLFDNPECQLPGYKPRAKRMWFQIKNGNTKLRNYGGDIYHEKKFKVLRAIKEQVGAFNV